MVSHVIALVIFGWLLNNEKYKIQQRKIVKTKNPEKSESNRTFRDSFGSEAPVLVTGLAGLGDSYMSPLTYKPFRFRVLIERWKSRLSKPIDKKQEISANVFKGNRGFRS